MPANMRKYGCVTPTMGGEKLREAANVGAAIGQIVEWWQAVKRAERDAERLERRRATGRKAWRRFYLRRKMRDSDIRSNAATN